MGSLEHVRETCDPSLSIEVALFVAKRPVGTCAPVYTISENALVAAGYRFQSSFVFKDAQRGLLDSARAG
jgi:hypothetical protein